MSSISHNSTPNIPSPTQMVAPRPVPSRRRSRPRLELPRYMRSLPPRIMSEDVEYLERKGALEIPEIGFRNELLRTYVQYVHPYMPLLELRDFLQPIEKNDGAAQISLFLFQAVMFTATAYIDIRFLHAQGFENRKAARKAFFQRARVRLTHPRKSRTNANERSCCMTLTTSLIAYPSCKDYCS